MSNRNCDLLFEYLKSILYDTHIKKINLQELDDEYRRLGEGLQVLQKNVEEMKAYSSELSRGNLDVPLPPKENTLCYNLKNLHANFNHLVWKMKQIASGECSSCITYMGELSEAFNHMLFELGREQEREEQQKQYYEMLKTLNESTDDVLFLWNIKNGEISLANHTTGEFSFIQNGVSVYSVQSFLSVVSENDQGYVKHVISDIRSGERDKFDFDCRAIDQKGERYWINCRGSVQLDKAGNPDIALGRFSNTVLADKIDLLTGLMNYSKLLENMTKRLFKGRRGHLMIIGIDNFKDINQRMGRAYGNRLLKYMGEILEKACNKSLIQVYRLDGDQFGIDLGGFNARETEKYFQNIQVQMEGQCTLSAGVVSYPIEQISDSSVLMQYAESALERAKQNGRNRMEFFSSEDYEANLYRIEIQEELKKSVEHGFEGFELYYQPQVRIGDFSVYGAEALLRFTSEKHGFLSPAVFIPILEDTGMIVPVGKWVLEKALVQCARWRKWNVGFHISVNMSYIQLQEPSIVADVNEALWKSGLPGSALSLEITESIHLQNFHYYNNIFHQWRDNGIRISVDDFGTGYSSLEYLKNLDIDEIKIDKCFVSGIQKNAYNFRLLSNVLELAHSVHIRVCCEGVEMEEELNCLGQLYPELIQGFFFGRPIPGDCFEREYLMEDAAYHQKVINIRQSMKELGKVPNPEVENSVCYQQILDNLNVLIWLVDKESREVCYINAAAKRETGIYDYEGKKCYNLFVNAKQPCKGCKTTKSGHLECRFQYHLWEKSNGRMIFREKTVKWNNRKMKLIIGRDLMRENNRVYQEMKKELEVGRLVEEMYQLSFAECDISSFYKNILEFLKKTYRADRVLLYIYKEAIDTWSVEEAAYAVGVMEKPAHLSVVPDSKMKVWIEQLKAHNIVFVESTEEYKKNHWDLWKQIQMQNIKNSLLSAIWVEGKLYGFYCLDNVEKIHDDWSLLEKAAVITGRRIQAELQRTEIDGQSFSRVKRNRSNADILFNVSLGLWIIKINRNTGEKSLIVDEKMKQILGVKENLTPEEYYEYWHGRIHQEYTVYVQSRAETMMTTDKIVELEYIWNHPELGDVAVRCVGAKSSHENGVIVLEGYHRLLDDLSQKHAVVKRHGNC